MRTASSSRSADDLTARARIRDAAIDLLAREGPGVGLRTIAEAADVSLGLIRHHFGSKEGLRAACDEWVLDRFADLQREQATAADPVGTMMANAARTEEVLPLVQYAVSSLRHGGPFARAFFDRMVADAEEYLARSEESGLVRPSVAPAARARFLVGVALGGLMLEHVVADPDADPWEEYVARTTIPALELYTHGLLTDARMLDAYLDHLEDPS